MKIKEIYCATNLSLLSKHGAFNCKKIQAEMFRAGKEVKVLANNAKNISEKN